MMSRKMVTAHISCMFYSSFIHPSFFLSLILGALSPLASLGLPPYKSACCTSPLCFSLSDWDFTLAGYGMPSLSLGKHRVRLISCFKPLPAKPSPGKAMRGERSGDGKDRARGMAIHHSAGPWSPPATTLKHSPIGLTCSQKACHTQVGVRGNQTEEWRNEKGGERYNKRASLVDFMSLRPGVTGSSTPATVRERKKNVYGIWGAVIGGDRRKRRSVQMAEYKKKRTRKPY